MVLVYKCPGCGGEMHFDEASQMLLCDSCGTKQAIDKSREEGQLHGAAVHHCPNCGAEIIADENTSATFCSFCGAPTILSEQVTGVAAPEWVIPFRIDKAEAKQIFAKYCKKNQLIPADFRRNVKAGKISAIYVPFFLYDCTVSAKLDALCTRTKVHRHGDTETTETSFFNVVRDVVQEFQGLPADASPKMDDALMDLLEPFDYTQIKPFDPAYLSGFLSEKYGYDDKQLFPRVSERINGYAASVARSTISGYGTVSVTNSSVAYEQCRAHYTLLPVYTLAYTYRNKSYLFALNGQTGKLAGMPPVSTGRIAGWLGGIAAASYAVCNLIGLVIR